MERFKELCRELFISLNKGFKDYSLITQVNNATHEIIISNDINQIKFVTKQIITLYDSSNSQKMIYKGQFDPIHLRLKQICLQIIVKIIQKCVNKNQQFVQLSIAVSLLRLMIISERLLLQSQKANYKQTVAKCHSCCEYIFQIYKNQLESKLILLHYLNKIDIVRLQSDSELFQLQPNYFSNIFSVFFSVYQDINNQQFVLQFQYAQSCAMQILLKLLKKGKNNYLPIFQSFLSQSHSKLLINIQQRHWQKINHSNNIYLSLFIEITLHKSKQISSQCLYNLLLKEQNFRDSRVFDLSALSCQLLPLQHWFHIHNSKHLIASNQQLNQAYACFLHLFDHIQNKFTLLDLTMQVMTSLNNSQCNFNLLKRFLHILAFITAHNLQPSIVKEFVFKLSNLCGNNVQVLKTVHCLHLYSELRNGCTSEECYKKFVKSNNQRGQSEFAKILKLAYQGKELSEEDKKNCFSQPHFAVLFNQNNNINFILNISITELAKYKNMLKIFLQYFAHWAQQFVEYHSQKQTNNRNVLQKINYDRRQKGILLLSHLQQVLTYSNFKQLNSQQILNAEQILNISLQLIKHKTIKQYSCLFYKISCIALIMLLLTIQQVRNRDIQIILNKYSKLQRSLVYILQLIKNPQTKLPTKWLQICTSILLSNIQYLKQTNRVLQQGQLIFLQLVFQLVYILQLDQSRRLYLKFIDFELHALTNTIDDNLVIQDDDVQFQRICCGSLFIPAQLKLRLLRKMIAQDVCTQRGIASLEDYIQLVKLAREAKQRQIYSQQIIRIFGESGKKCLEVLAMKEPNLFQFLINCNSPSEQSSK